MRKRREHSRRARARLLRGLMARERLAPDTPADATAEALAHRLTGLPRTAPTQERQGAWWKDSGR